MKCDAGDDVGLVGDPISVVSGANLDSAQDFCLWSEWPLRWDRSYDSRNVARTGRQGRAWRDPFDYSLQYDLDGMLYVPASGSPSAFPFLTRDGERAARRGRVLIRESETRFRVEERGRPSVAFDLGEKYDVPARPTRLWFGKYEVHLQYDSSSRLVRIVDAVGRRLRLTYDRADCIEAIWLEQSGRALVRYQYDGSHRLLAAIAADQSQWQYTYDPAGRLTRKVDPTGYAFEYTYDGSGRCVRAAGQDGVAEVRLSYSVGATVVREASGGEWTYLYDESGSITQIVDPYGGKRVFAFDESDGKLIARTDAAGDTTRIGYDLNGAPSVEVDALGRVRRPAPREPDEPRAWSARAIEIGGIDDAGTAPLVAGSPALYSVPPLIRPALIADATPPMVPKAVVDRITRDTVSGATQLLNDQAVVVEERWADGTARYWDNDPLGTHRGYVDRDGRRYHWQYESWRHRVAETDPTGATARWEWSPSEQLTAFTDAGGTRSEYRYDLKDRLIEVRRAGSVRESYEYDSADRLVAKYDAAGGVVLKNSYGPGGVLRERVLASGEKHRFSYDEAGRIELATNGRQEFQFSTNPWGLRVRDERDGRGVIHEADQAGIRATTVFGSFRMEFTRERTGRRIRLPNGSEILIRVLARGVIERKFGNAGTEVSQFDRQGRCIAKGVQVSVDETEHAWLRRYTYSGEGDLLRTDDTLWGTTLYEHDEAHRLHAIRRPDGARDEYAYDRAGNLLAKPGLEGAAFAHGNRLEAANQERFVYDDRHHISVRRGSNGETRYLRDSFGQIVGVETTEGNWRAEYDVFGRRTRKQWQGRATEFYWDRDRLAAEVLPGGAVRIYAFADDEALVPTAFVDYESVDAAPESGTAYYIEYNHLGSPLAVVDEAGHVVWSAAVEPYGETRVAKGDGFHQPLRMPGHYLDAETGLHYNRHRYYDPRLGRYLEADPAGISGGDNVYAYTENPLREADPLGLCPTDGPPGNREREGTAQKRKGAAEPPEGGWHNATDEQLREHLGGLAQAAWERMRAAHAADERTVTLEDGTVLRVGDGHRQRGPCLSLVMDMVTGRVFFGQNTGREPTGLAEPLASRTQDVAAANQAESPVSPPLPQGWTRLRGIPGSHSEVQASNQALQARPGAQMSDLAIYNVRTEDIDQPVAPPMTRCGNCAPITAGARALTEEEP